MFECYKPIYHFTSCILFINALLISCFAFHCVHDKVNEQRRRSARSVKYQDIRIERDKNPDLFEALDIHFYIDKFDPAVSLNTLHNIKLALDKVDSYIQNTFQVRKRSKPYLLERLSCTARWKKGKNKGRCSSFNNAPELCDTDAVKYVIPDRYLDKLEVYEFDKSQPNVSIPSGPGVLEANFITFITFQTESFCRQGAIAFGSYCRLDQKTSEPLAGILNLCPQAFFGETKRFQYYYNVILHEIFHIMGFSVKLFDKFIPCVKGIYCPMPQKIIQEDKSKIFRLMFPLVIESMQNHFGCSNPDFGGPLALKETAKETGDKLPYSSHWHPILMYSSIMTPSYTEHEDLLVDNITLSLFASTGWYHVNFSFVDTFNFGSGQGCEFGVSGKCDNRFLCNTSNENFGCDMVHKTIGKCQNLTSHHPCGVYIPNTKRDCEGSIPRYLDIDFEVLGFKRKCFMKQVSGADPEPSCLPVQCKTKDTYNVLINMTWYPCYKMEKISKQNITILCPDGVLFCPDTLPALPRRFCPSDIYFFVAIRMYFQRPTFQELSDFHNFKNFKVTTIKAIASIIDIPENYIVNSSLSVFKQIFLDFTICPPADLNAKELNKILKNTQKFLDGNFVYILKGPTDQFISSNDIKIDPVDLITFSDHDGFRSLLAFPVICAIFLIATFIASVFRLLLLQRHKPKRSAKNTDDIQLSEVNTS